MTTSPTPDPDKATPSPAVAEVANLIERLSEFEGSCPCHDCTLHAEAADALERLASDKARLEGERDTAERLIAIAHAETDRVRTHYVEKLSAEQVRAERAEAERRLAMNSVPEPSLLSAESGEMNAPFGLSALSDENLRRLEQIFGPQSASGRALAELERRRAAGEDATAFTDRLGYIVVGPSIPSSQLGARGT